MLFAMSCMVLASFGIVTLPFACFRNVSKGALARASRVFLWCLPHFAYFMCCFGTRTKDFVFSKCL